MMWRALCPAVVSDSSRQQLEVLAQKLMSQFPGVALQLIVRMRPFTLATGKTKLSGLDARQLHQGEDPLHWLTTS
jgi:hypothetical protein